MISVHELVSWEPKMLELFLYCKDSAWKWRWVSDTDSASVFAFKCLWSSGQILSPQLSSYVTHQDNDSPLNSLFLRGWNKITCKIKSFSDLKTSSERVLVENKIMVLTCICPFFWRWRTLGPRWCFHLCFWWKLGLWEKKDAVGHVYLAKLLTGST